MRPLDSLIDMSHEPKPNPTPAPLLFELDTPSPSDVRAIPARALLSAARMPATAKTKRKPAPAAAPRAKMAKDVAARSRRPRRWTKFVLDRVLLNIVAVLLVSSVSSLVVSQEPGITGEPTMRRLTRAEMPALSSLLVAGDLRASGDGQRLHGWISGTRWRALDPSARRVAASALAHNLAASGINAAELYDHATLVLVIRDGALVHAAGAAP